MSDAKTYDLIIIGGGINGTGVVREAALRGLRTLLLEKNDLGAGTSAYSTRLIHGGLRYLEQMEIPLVRESLRERERLLRNAPHLVHPLELGIPVYESKQYSGLLSYFKSKGKHRPLWIIGMGMWLYDALSFDRSVPGFRIFNSAASFVSEFQGVNPEHMEGGASYYDAQVIFPERVCVENALDAVGPACEEPATILTHTEVTGLLLKPEGEKGDFPHVRGVAYRDLLTGEQAEAYADVVINAAGAWVDSVAQLAAQTTWEPPAKNIDFPRMMGGTQGTHIVVKRFSGGPEKGLYIEAESDGRPYFIVPWQEGFYLIGTTDDVFDGNLDNVQPQRKDVPYLIAETNRVLPKANLTEGDVLYAYSGVRPLPYQHADAAGKITRKHIIADHAKEIPYRGYNLTSHAKLGGFVSIIGGKLTTYRNLSDEAIQYVLTNYGLQRRMKKIVSTENRPLPGAVDIITESDDYYWVQFDAYKLLHTQASVSRYGVSDTIVRHLIDSYGSRYELVLERLIPDAEHSEEWCNLLRKPLSDASPRIGAQVVYAIECEMVRTLPDVMRRLGSNLNAQVGLDEVEGVADILERYWQWSPEQRRMYVDSYRAHVQHHYLGFRQKACV